MIMAGQAGAVLGGLGLDAGQGGAFLLGLHRAHGLAVHEEQVIGKPGLQPELAHGYAAAGLSLGQGGDVLTGAGFGGRRRDEGLRNKSHPHWKPLRVAWNSPASSATRPDAGWLASRFPESRLSGGIIRQIIRPLWRPGRPAG